MNQPMIYSFISVLATMTLLQISVVQTFTYRPYPLLDNRKQSLHKKKSFTSTISSFYTHMLKHILNYLSQLKSTNFISKQIIYPINRNQYIMSKTGNNTQNPLYIETSLSRTLQYG